MNRDILNIINRYITYSNDTLDKLITKNYYIKQKILFNGESLLKLSLFDILLKAISIGFGRVWLIYIENVFTKILKKYNKCEYKHLYKVYKSIDKIYIESNNNKLVGGINIDALYMF